MAQIRYKMGQKVGFFVSPIKCDAFTFGSMNLHFNDDELILVGRFILELQKLDDDGYILGKSVGDYGISEELNKKMFILLHDHFKIIIHPRLNDFYQLNSYGRAFNVDLEIRKLVDDANSEAKERDVKKKTGKLTEMQLEHLKLVLSDYDETKSNARTAKHVAWIAIIVNIILTAYVIWSKS